jgi:preprotein translocase subunit YajC
MGAQGSLLGSLLPLIVLFAIFYFLIIKPQQKQQQEHKNMMESLKKGDKIIINGGVIVEIIKIEDTFYTVKNIDNTTMRIAKDYIASKWEE